MFKILDKYWERKIYIYLNIWSLISSRSKIRHENEIKTILVFQFANFIFKTIIICPHYNY